jgi:hypothetical protein
MLDYREINALQRDAGRARDLARFLLRIPDLDLTDWEADFLEHMSARREELTTRQAEKLVEVRDASVWHERVDNFPLRSLVKSCWEMRHLLSEGDEEFIQRLHEEGAVRLRRRAAARLMRCARTAGEIEPYQGWSLEPSTE